ncbi:MAG: hypothetical protein J6T86_01060 [Bacteroidales bacterium]|nr:hypothetical protein [Bacteroidales bacterium]
MTHKHLSRRALLLALGLSLCMGLTAQVSAPQKKNSFWIDLNAGVGAVTCYDNGTIPFAYQGVSTDLGIGFTDEWKRCHISLDFQRFRNILSEPEGTSYGIDGRLEFLYSCLKSSESRWHFWSGASLEAYGELKSIPELQNASASVSIFSHLGLTEKISCDFGYDKERTHRWMTAFFKLYLPLASHVSRPDFMYVHDPLGEISVSTILAGNEKFFKFFPGASTDFGFTLNLRNGNRISLSYMWYYLTTGKKGANRYDNAYHMLNLSLMFKL